MAKFTNFCGYANGTECMEGLGRLQVFFNAFKLHWDNVLLPQVEKQYPGLYEFGMNELQELGKRIYGKSFSQVQTIFKQYQDELAAEGKTLYMMWWSQLTDVLTKLGITSPQNFTVFNEETSKEDFEWINPLDVQGSFSKFPYGSQSETHSAGDKSAFYVPQQFPFLAVYPEHMIESYGRIGELRIKPTAYQWAIMLPLVLKTPIDTGGGNGGGGGDTGGGNTGGGSKGTEDCPCEEIERDITVYLRPTKGSDKDVAIPINFKKETCKGTDGSKKVKIDCEEEIGKIILQWGKK